MLAKATDSFSERNGPDCRLGRSLVCGERA
jgi:hypothetical protein